MAQDERDPGQKPESTVKQEDSAADKKNRPDVSNTDREAAMKFAAENHPELARLLEQLRKSRPSEFSRAIKELHQQIVVLERVREKNASRYATQLESWKHDSQIRVLMARWSRSKDVELEKQVRELLKKRREAKIAQMKAEKDRIAEQQRKIDEQLAAMSEPLESQIDKEWEQLSKKAAFRKESSKATPEVPTAAAVGAKK